MVIILEQSDADKGPHIMQQKGHNCFDDYLITREACTVDGSDWVNTSRHSDRLRVMAGSQYQLIRGFSTKLYQL